MGNPLPSTSTPSRRRVKGPCDHRVPLWTVEFYSSPTDCRSQFLLATDPATGPPDDSKTLLAIHWDWTTSGDKWTGPLSTEPSLPLPSPYVQHPDIRNNYSRWELDSTFNLSGHREFDRKSARRKGLGSSSKTERRAPIVHLTHLSEKGPPYHNCVSGL